MTKNLKSCLKKKNGNKPIDKNPPRFVISVHNNPPPSETELAATMKMKTRNGTIHVLVIAHPDDESMFFLPTLTSLRDAGETVWILCLTTGNYDGLGDRRQIELSRVCHLLQVDRLIQLDVEALKDHPTESWSLDCVTNEIERSLSTAIRTCGLAEAVKRLVLITFDLHGISGHINHRDTYLGVRNLVIKRQRQQQQGAENTGAAIIPLPPLLEAWKLETVHFLPFKYLPVFEWVRLFFFTIRLWKPRFTPLPIQQQKQQDKANKCVHVYRSMQNRLSWRAMATHESQFVWYRRLFVVFSCYTFVNRLRPVQ